MLKYKRISLKLSGEAMGGAQAVDFDKAEAIARQVARLHELGAEIGITIGGGNICAAAAPAIWTATGRIKWVCWRLS